MSDQNDIVHLVVAAARERIERHAAELEESVQALRKEYPSAASFEVEVETVVRSDRAFAGRLEGENWGEKVRDTTDRICELLKGDALGHRLVWNDQKEQFDVVGYDGLRGDRHNLEGVEIGAWVDVLVAASEEGIGEVGYPIIFTHQSQGNYRSLLLWVGWAVVVQACRQVVLLREKKVDGIELYFRSRKIVAVDAQNCRQEKCSLEWVPSAQELGFSPRGELFRRIDTFVQSDEQAHWMRWVMNRRRAVREERTLREQGGATITMHVDRRLRRLRESSQPRSQVVRKRRHVFVEQQPAQVEDFFFSSEDRLDQSLQERLRAHIEDGFRIVDEELEEEVVDDLTQI